MAQTRSVSLEFKPVMHDKMIAVFKFYVSDISFSSHGKTVFSAPDTYFLIDAADNESRYRTLQIPQDCKFDAVTFTVGIDAKTNEKGIGDGDLDPLHGMYWAWQSGYINLKLEGQRNGKPFEFHLGGFQQPYLACRPVTLSAGEEHMVIFADPLRMLEKIPDETPNVMSPGDDAVKLSELAVEMFYR